MDAWVRKHGRPLIRHARGGGHPEKGQKHWIPAHVLITALQRKPALLSAYLLKAFQKRKKSHPVSPRKTQNISS